jgi:hypothetical protein
MAEITYHDVASFISDHCPDFRCPACGATKLQPAAEGGGKPIALLYEDSPAKSWFGPPGYLRVFALNCASCSYVMIFRLDALERLIRARPHRDAAASRAAGSSGHAGVERRSQAAPHAMRPRDRRPLPS